MHNDDPCVKCIPFHSYVFLQYDDAETLMIKRHVTLFSSPFLFQSSDSEHQTTLTVLSRLYIFQLQLIGYSLCIKFSIFPSQKGAFKQCVALIIHSFISTSFSRGLTLPTAS